MEGPWHESSPCTARATLLRARDGCLSHVINSSGRGFCGHIPPQAARASLTLGRAWLNAAAPTGGARTSAAGAIPRSGAHSTSPYSLGKPQHVAHTGDVSPVHDFIRPRGQG